MQSPLQFGEHLELLLNATPRRGSNGDVVGAVFVGQECGLSVDAGKLGCHATLADGKSGARTSQSLAEQWKGRNRRCLHSLQSSHAAPSLVEWKVADDLKRLLNTANAPIFEIDVEGKAGTYCKLSQLNVVAQSRWEGDGVEPEGCHHDWLLERGGSAPPNQN